MCIRDSITIDLYAMLIKGKRLADIRLDEGDMVFVPPIGKLAGIAGEVKRPGIYELKKEKTLGELTDLAGGITPFAQLKRVQIMRIRDHEFKTVLDVEVTHFTEELKAFKVEDGDLAIIYPLPPFQRNYVKITGEVINPGMYEFTEGMTLEKLINKAGGVTRGAIDRIIIYRYIDSETRKPVIVRVDDAKNIKLSEWDSIVVFSHSEVKKRYRVALVGEFNYPGVYFIEPGALLSDVIEHFGGGFTQTAFLPGAVFIRRSAKERTFESTREFIMRMEEEILRSEIEIEESALTPAEKESRRALLEERKKWLRELKNRLPPGRVIIDLEKIVESPGSSYDFPVEDGDSLYVPLIPYNVYVLGAVYNPGAFPYFEGKGVKYYLQQAGGFTPQAYRRGTYILKSSGIVVRSNSTIDRGDAIIVPYKTRIKRAWTESFRQWLMTLSNIALSAAAVWNVFKK